MNQVGQEHSQSPTPLPCGFHHSEPAATNGVLSRWKSETITPRPEPALIRKITLELDGGLTIKTDNEFHSRIVYVTVPSEVTKFKWDESLDVMAREIPRRLLPVLRAAVADLERICSE